MEGDCTHNPEDWNNKSIKCKYGETLGPPRSTDKLYFFLAFLSYVLV